MQRSPLAGLGERQLRALDAAAGCCRAHGSTYAGEIARRLGIPTGNAVAAVKSLRDRGLLEDVGGQRAGVSATARLVRLTDPGQRLLALAPREGRPWPRS